MVRLFDISRFFGVIPKIFPYLGITLQIVFVGVFFGSLAGIFVAAARINKIPVLDPILSVYISFMRGTPMLIQMMVLYYGLPVFLKSLTGIDINGWDKLVFVELTFVLNEAAFLGEMFRGGIEAVPYEQTEAGYSVGLNRFQTFTRIVLPQAARIILPAYGVDIVGVFHNTQIAFMLGAVDMLGRAKTIGIATKHSLEAYLVAAIIYIIISILLRLTFNLLDKKLAYGRRVAASGV